MSEYASQQSYERLTPEGGSEEVTLEFVGGVCHDSMWIDETYFVAGHELETNVLIDVDTAEALIGAADWDRMVEAARQEMIEKWTEGE